MAYGNSNEASPLGRLKSLNGAGGSDQDVALSQDVRIAALPNCYTIVLDSKMLSSTIAFFYRTRTARTLTRITAKSHTLAIETIASSPSALGAEVATAIKSVCPTYTLLRRVQRLRRTLQSVSLRQLRRCQLFQSCLQNTLSFSDIRKSRQAILDGQIDVLLDFSDIRLAGLSAKGKESNTPAVPELCQPEHCATLPKVHCTNKKKKFFFCQESSMEILFRNNTEQANVQECYH